MKFMRNLFTFSEVIHDNLYLYGLGALGQPHCDVGSMRTGVRMTTDYNTGLYRPSPPGTSPLHTSSPPHLHHNKILHNKEYGLF